MTPRKKWFTVQIVAEKTVRIYAEDEQEAKDKADAKYQPLWSAEDAWEETRVSKTKHTNLFCGECKTELIQENYTLKCPKCDLR